MRRSLAVLVVLLSSVTSLSAAQTFTVTLGAASSPSATSPTLALALEGGRVGRATVGLTLSYHEAAQLGLTLSENRSFGPLGNLIVDLAADVRTDGAARAALSARTVIGPVSVRAVLGAFTHDAARFDAAAAAGAASPRFGDAGSGFSLRLGASGRLNRSLVLEAEPELYLVSGALATRVDARLRWLRAFGDNELRLLARAYSGAPGAGGHAAAGVGLVLGRGRAPDWGFGVTLGVSGGRLSPGVTVELVERFGGGQVLSLSLAAEPYRADVDAYRAVASFEAPWGRGRALLAAHAATGGRNHTGTSLAFSAGYSLPAELR